MPLLTITTNITLDEQSAQALCSKASTQVAGMLGKPESYVMISIIHSTCMSFAGDNSPCAMLELKSLGLPEQQTAAFSDALCSFITTETGIPASRIYIQFSGPERHMWGWDRRTF
jgi:phenylpyruvate tautomerase PptA (4-oxalocrotonate tautomerase family)